MGLRESLGIADGYDTLVFEAQGLIRRAIKDLGRKVVTVEEAAWYSSREGADLALLREVIAAELNAVNVPAARKLSPEDDENS